MQKVSKEYILIILFKESLDKEELLIEKYEEYYPDLENKALRDMIEDFKKTSQEHISLVKDKLIKLGLQG